jgi:hypothetical protein
MAALGVEPNGRCLGHESSTLKNGLMLFLQDWVYSHASRLL